MDADFLYNGPPFDDFPLHSQAPVESATGSAAGAYQSGVIRKRPWSHNRYWQLETDRADQFELGTYLDLCISSSQRGKLKGTLCSIGSTLGC